MRVVRLRIMAPHSQSHGPNRPMTGEQSAPGVRSRVFTKSRPRDALRPAGAGCGPARWSGASTVLFSRESSPCSDARNRWHTLGFCSADEVNMRDRSLESMPSGGHVAGAAASPTRALVLATISFALSFAAWGLVGGLASVFTGLYGLTASQTALLVAVPVLLGSLARLPMGMLTDRFGGRLVFTALLAFSSLAAFVVPLTGSYGSLLVAAFLIGMAGIVLRGRRRVRVPLDPGGSAGHGPRRLRAGDDGAIAGRLRRPGGRGSPGLGGGVSRHQRAAPGLGGGVLPAGAESPAGRAPRHRRRDDRGPAARADRLAARRLLLPDLRRLRRVLDLPADAAARAVRPGSRGRRIPGGRVRRARHAHAARSAGGWRTGSAARRSCRGSSAAWRCSRCS